MDTSRFAMYYNLIQLIFNMTSLLMTATAVVASSKYLVLEFFINLLAGLSYFLQTYFLILEFSLYTAGT